MQTAAEAEAKQADIRSKHLQKQLAEQQKGLRSKEQEAKKLQQDLTKEQARVQACQQQYASSLTPCSCVLLHCALPMSSQDANQIYIPFDLSNAPIILRILATHVQLCLLHCALLLSTHGVFLILS